MAAVADWKEIKSIFAAVLELDPSSRAAFLDEACAGRPEVRAELESLLAAHFEASGFLSQAASPVRVDEFAEPPLDLSPGGRLGVYTIVQKIDEGGMATVYQAVRDDAEFRKLVAIKILKAGMDTSFILDRFQKEKQILAHFDHPYIAKLLDGGTTPDRRPYFVLEFIAGQPIDVYCRDRNLSIDERLRLFQKVCSAVEYAHQNLIVHRDLKPRNILVTDDGTPKLLDFGIAKILSDEREMTVTGLRLMTPEYASPEQVRGGPISTMTDVYGLGVILYELLAGARPFRAESPHELARLIMESEPKRPSTSIRNAAGANPQWAAKLKSDLDNVVLKAMHADPRRRYQSVRELSADIDRYFAGQPVLAAGDDFAYIAKKFITRHRSVVLAAVLSVLSLVIGLVLVEREAMIARNQRAMSEQRAAEIRRLANSLIFDLHDAIQSLPGSTPVRATLMDRATSALDGLSSNASEDPAIQRELAAAYRRLGQVQGSPTQANLGNFAAALASYRKAQTILEKIHKTSPGDIETTRALASVAWEISSISSRQGDKKTEESAAQRALELRESAARAQPQTIDSRRDLAIAFYMRGHMAVNNGDLEAARGARRRSYELWEAVLKEDPSDARTRYEVALAAKNLSAVEQRFKDYASAEKLLERAGEIDRERVTASPQDASAQLDLSFDLSELAELSIRRNDWNGAAEKYQQARGIREDLLAHDPDNQRLKDRVAYILSRSGRVDLHLGRINQARPALQRALDLRREIAANSPGVRARFNLAESEGDFGNWRCASGDIQRGRGDLQRALASIEELNRRSAISVEDQESASELRAALDRCGASRK